MLRTALNPYEVELFGEYVQITRDWWGKGPTLALAYADAVKRKWEDIIFWE